MILSQKSADESPNYEYVNAVVRARAARLLGRDVFLRLASGAPEDLELFLLESQYGPRYREQLATGGGSLLGRIENALSAGTADLLLDTALLARGETFVFICLILSMGDLHNGRILLRASPGPLRQKNSPSWHRYALADTSFYDDLWRKHATPAAGAIRCHQEDNDIARILGVAYMTLHETGDLFRAERSFYSGWAEWWRKQAATRKNQNGRRMAEYLGRLTDLWNFSIWLRRGSKEEGEPEYFTGGWGFSKEILQSSRDMEALFASSGWKDIPGLGEGRAESEIFRSFQRSFYEWQRRLYRKNLLGIDVLLGYSARAVQEWKNLSLIAVGASLKMSPEEIAEHLFLPDEGTVKVRD
ncbi:MAG: V-type ATPase subunit [Aminivibrio sp.]|jgi:vacuolar-type H+-ATPase subunit C/Vma6|nr:V-type ATPase subunit [Synergistaceae bacterium]